MSGSTRSHFTHARSCSRALNQVPTRAKQPASIRTYFLWKGDIFSFDRFTGYTKSNQNRFGRVLPFAFALTCYKIYLFFPSLSDFDSFSWRVHLSYGVCRLRARVQLKTLSSLLTTNHVDADWELWLTVKLCHEMWWIWLVVNTWLPPLLSPRQWLLSCRRTVKLYMFTRIFLPKEDPQCFCQIFKMTGLD